MLALYSQVCWRYELRPSEQGRELGFPVMTSGWFITVGGKMWNTGCIVTRLPTPPQHTVWMWLCILHAQCAWFGWLGAVAVAYRILSWEAGRARARPWDTGIPFWSRPPIWLELGHRDRLPSIFLHGGEMGLRQLQIIAQQPWHCKQPFFFFLGWKMVRMASSKTALRPFWVRAEHSK